MNIENQEIIIKIPLRSKFYEFWFIKHPLFFLWVWLLSILIMSLIISEYYKNN